MLLIPLLSGCESPAQIYYNSQETFIAAMKVSIDLRDSQKLKPGEWQNTFLPIIMTCDGILDDMKIAVENGQNITVKTLAFSLSENVIKLKASNNHVRNRIFGFTGIDNQSGKSERPCP